MEKELLEQLTHLAKTYSGPVAIVLVGLAFAVRYFIKERIARKEKELQGLIDDAGQIRADVDQCHQSLYGVGGNGDRGLIKRFDQMERDFNKRFDTIDRNLARLEGKLDR